MQSEDKKRQFERLYEREADALFRFCLLRTGNREQAKDLVQDAFTRVWKALLAGKELTEGRGYLFAITRNLLIDGYRKSRTESLDALMESAEDEMPFEPADPKALAALSLSAEVGEVLAAIEALPDIYRESVYLRLMEEMLPKEIAEVLGMNANTVSIRITRGLEQVRAMLGIEAPDKEDTTTS